jgi:nucleotide-binding universal stress UspA family protein
LFRKILVPLDFTEKNASALRVAQELAVQNHAEVQLLHVIELVEHIALDELAAFYRELEQAARARLDSAATPFSEQNIPVETAVEYGRRAEDIVRFAAAQGVDLIVLSSHQIRADRPASGWGTISYKVAILAPCPVLLVK